MNLAIMFQIVQDMYTDPEDAWVHMRGGYNKIASTVLGNSHRPAEEWITEETWEEIGRRKDCKKIIFVEKCQVTKQFLQFEYKKIDKSVKRKTRRDKIAYMDKLAEKLKMQPTKET